MQAIRSRGLVVPDDIAVVGFDDVPVAAALRPQLTTVRQPLVRMGEEMATLLVDALEGRPDASLGHPADGAGGTPVGLIRPTVTKSSLDIRLRLVHHFARSWERSHRFHDPTVTATRRLQPGS